jgi:multisubunit Na+/H+ antiporter MnhF subunit
VLIPVALTVATGRQAFVDLAVVFAPMSIGGSLAFSRWMERQQER